MSRKSSSRPVRFTTMLVVLALALGALALAGCGGTVESPGGPSGTGAPANVKYVNDATRLAVLAAIKPDYVFGPDYVWVVATDSPDTVMVTGPTTDAKTKEKFNALTVVKGKDGKWAVTLAQ